MRLYLRLNQYRKVDMGQVTELWLSLQPQFRDLTHMHSYKTKFMLLKSELSQPVFVYIPNQLGIGTLTVLDFLPGMSAMFGTIELSPLIIQWDITVSRSSLWYYDCGWLRVEWLWNMGRSYGVHVPPELGGCLTTIYQYTILHKVEQQQRKIIG